MKNLSVINSKYFNQKEKALGYLIKVKIKSSIWNSKSNNICFCIQAATIDGTDLELWHEIGRISLELKKYLISKWSFQECLNINPNHWISLDNLIVLIYSLRDYQSNIFNNKNMNISEILKINKKI